MKLGEAVELIIKTLPRTIDVTPSGEFVSDSYDYGEVGYFENINAHISVMVHDLESLTITYYRDDDEYIFVTDKYGDDYFNFLSMNEEEVKYKVIEMFSDTFGWIEQFKSHKVGNNI